MWTETKCDESPLGKLKCQGRFSIPTKLKLDFRHNLIPGSLLLDEIETCCLHLQPHSKVQKLGTPPVAKHWSGRLKRAEKI